MSQVSPPPKTFFGILKQLGPGLIISANIVGSGELIVTTKLGAKVGFTLLWFIIFGCVIKVFLQVELGRYSISKGKTALDAMNSVPGPRFKVSWLVWCWVIMFVAIFFQVSGMVGALIGVFRMGGISIADSGIVLCIVGSCAVFLFIGRYQFVERFATAMVAIFTMFTIFAVFSLNWTDYGIKASDLMEGLSFQLPDSTTTAFAAFGVIGVGASELIFYPIWCLEKGYARHVGPNDGSEAWKERAQGWMHVLRCDAWVSMVIYTGATVAFYLLGAAVLHGKGLEVSDTDLMPTLSNIYSESFGIPGMWIFIVGAFVVLYSTVFISTASNARLATDLARLLKIGRLDTPEQKANAVKLASVLIPVLYFIFYTAIPKAVTLVLIGALAQALMLPFLCFAALYLLYRDTEPGLKPGRLWITLLWISSLMMASVGIYQIIDKVSSQFK
ncbi:MAG: Nramp family divalent metal transporter [Verrucomicrobia bacterium]|nr:Nramp family divalent metal transporter [Verrucomicrobiota bacterium]